MGKGRNINSRTPPPPISHNYEKDTESYAEIYQYYARELYICSFVPILEGNHWLSSLMGLQSHVIH